MKKAEKAIADCKKADDTGESIPPDKFVECEEAIQDAIDLYMALPKHFKSVSSNNGADDVIQPRVTVYVS